MLLHRLHYAAPVTTRVAAVAPPESHNSIHNRPSRWAQAHCRLHRLQDQWNRDEHRTLYWRRVVCVCSYADERAYLSFFHADIRILLIGGLNKRLLVNCTY